MTADARPTRSALDHFHYLQRLDELGTRLAAVLGGDLEDLNARARKAGALIVEVPSR